MNYLKSLFTLTCFFYSMTILEAQEEKMLCSPALIPRQLLFGNPQKAGAQISTDGTKLAYLAPDEQNVLNIWVRDLAKEGSDRQVTADHKRGIHNYLWQFDNEHILYIQDKDGDEKGHLYQTHLKTQTTKDLTPFEGVKVEILSANYRFPNELLILMNKRDPSLFDVYRLDLRTGEITLDTENPGGVAGWLADHNQHVRVSQSITSDGATLIRVRDELNKPWRDWLTIAADEIGEVQDFSDDNQSLYLMTSLGANTSRLLKVNIATGERKLMTEDAHYDLDALILHPTQNTPEAVAVHRERLDWIVLDPELHGDFNTLRTRFKGSFALVSRDLKNQNWIVVSFSDNRPSHYYLYRRPNKELTFLFSTQPELERYALNSMQPISFKARDGMQLHGYLTLPKGLQRNLPTVLLVHGGPWTRDYWGLSPQVQWLSNRGYAVLQINYRGSTGYGKAYVNAGNREWANKMHMDLIDGKNWLVQKGIADPQKVAIFGGSYGGYATLVGLTFTPDEFCCGVDIVGPSNLITLLQTLPPYWSPLKPVMDLRVGKLDTDNEFLKSRSPLFKVDQIRKPLLIGQGANDPRVKQAESDQIVASMRQKNLPVEYLLFLDEGHGFVRPENRLKFMAAAEDFLAKYLGGQREAPNPEENWEKLKQ